jgi:excinuclease UvrABC nuclease subunit
LQISWSKYKPLNEENIKTNVQEKPGVYRLAEPTGETNVWPFYVGQADDLRARLLKHISASEENSCIKKKVSQGKCEFRFAYVSRAEDRNSIERALYDHFDKPVCNVNVPPGTAFEVNFE